MGDINPIGIFDSGIGGLSVLRWIREELPHEDLLYIADSIHAPYGNKTTAYIEQRAISLTRFLLEQKAKAVVVACNTATAAAVSTLRDTFNVPIIGMEPGVKPAISITKTGTVGILATTETLKSAKFANLTSRFCNDFKIIAQDCPGLVELVEKASLTDDTTRDLVRSYVSPLLEKGADTIVLGCTHYPFLAPLIESIVGENIVIIDTGAAVAREVGRRLREAEILSDNKNYGEEVFWTTGDREGFQRTLKSLWNREVTVNVCPFN